jgi:hypothetical protein
MECTEESGALDSLQRAELASEDRMPVGVPVGLWLGTGASSRDAIAVMDTPSAVETEPRLFGSPGINAGFQFRSKESPNHDVSRSGHKGYLAESRVRGRLYARRPATFPGKGHMGISASR